MKFILIALILSILSLIDSNKIFSKEELLKYNGNDVIIDMII
jgi:hypothetical protein